LVELAESVALLGLDDVGGRDLGNELVELFRLRSMLDAQVARRVREFDVRGDAVNGGHRSTAAWLMDHCRCRPTDAYREVRVARATRDLDGLREAWEAGRTTSEHVRVVEQARHAAKDNAAFAEFESAVVRVCESGSVDDTTTVLARWRDALDAHRQSDDTLAAKAVERRDLSLSDTMEQGYLDARMDLTDFAIVKEAIENERERGHVEGDERTAGQQRLDALVAMCKRTLDGQNPGGSNRPHLLLVTDPETVAGLAAGRADTASGIHLPVSAVQRLACDGLISRVILDADGQVLDLGRAVRTFTFEQRKAMIARDGGCCFPGCGRPATDCEAHHEPPWAEGGQTNLDHGFLGCWPHHRLIHEQGWKVRRNPNGTLDWYKPDGTFYGRWKSRPPPDALPL
jgi:hypothetical protein